MNSLLQPVQQITDRETDDLRTDNARLDLVYVEQRVQHARHGGQRLVEPRHQLFGFVALDNRRQKPLKESQRLKRLAEVMAGRGQKPRLRDACQFRLLLGDRQRVRRASPFGDVDEGDDDALDPVVLGAVRQLCGGCTRRRPELRSPVRQAPASAIPLRASARRLSSAASDLRSASGRPTSLGMTLKSDLVAGVKKRMLRLVSRKSVATSELYRTFCRSLEVVRCRSSVS